MNRVTVFISFATLLFAISGWASLLTPAQQQRANFLYTRFVAPCCWRQSVAVHQSPEALQVRQRIDSELMQGQSDFQIKEGLIRTYGHGILMEPEGIRAVAAYGVPALFVVAALLVAFRWLRRKISRIPAFPAELSLPTVFPDLELEP